MSDSKKHILIFDFYHTVYQAKEPELFFCEIDKFEKQIHNLITLAFKSDSKHFSIDVYEAELEEDGNIKDALLGDYEQLTDYYSVLRDEIFIKIIDFLRKYDATTLWYRIFRGEDNSTIFEFKFIDFNDTELSTFEDEDDIYYLSAGIFNTFYDEDKILNQANKNINWNRRNISDN